jgi:hypothetical protein
MKHLAQYAFALILLVGSSSFAYAQGFSVESNSPTAPAGSETFTSVEGRFKASLPQQPSSFRPESAETPEGRAEGELYTWMTSYGQFAIAFIDRPTQIEKFGKTGLDNFRDSLLAKVFENRGKLVNETDVSLDGHPGRELKIEFPDSLLLFRIYLVNKRMYQLSAVVINEKRAQETEAAKVFASFKLLTQAEIDAQLRQKAAAATPSPLPQEPVTKKLKSDAEDEGLKGRVKTVFAESEDLSGTWAVGKRKPSSMKYFNERGNLTKSELYDYKGNLFQISAYGYIDGERASNDEIIEHGYNPPPMAIAVAPGPTESKYDPRYHYKYRYKYDDQGNLKEKEMHSNNGKLWLRYTYQIKGDQKETLVYSEDGTLNQKSLATLDAQGRETEESYFDIKTNTVKERYSYTYEFDTKGNWIKRTASKWATRDGKSQFAPYSITYRTITYY